MEFGLNKARRVSCLRQRRCKLAAWSGELDQEALFLRVTSGVKRAGVSRAGGQCGCLLSIHHVTGSYRPAFPHQVEAVSHRRLSEGSRPVPGFQSCPSPHDEPPG